LTPAPPKGMTLTPELRFLAHYTQVLRTQLATARTQDEPATRDHLALRLDGAADACGGPETALTLPLQELAASVHMDRRDLDLVLFAAASRLDPTLRYPLRTFMPEAGSLPTAEHWLQLLGLDDPIALWAEQRRINPTHTPFALGLVQLEDTDAGPLTARLNVPDHVLAWLAGDRRIGLALAPFVRGCDDLWQVARPGVPVPVLAMVQALVTGWFAAPAWASITDRRTTAALLVGPRGAGKTQAAQWVCARLGRRWLELDAARLTLESTATVAGVLEDTLAQAALHREVLIIDGAEQLLATNTPGSIALQSATRRHNALVLLVTRDHERIDPVLRDLVSVYIEFPLPAFAAIAEVWEIAFSLLHLNERSPVTAAERFPLDGRQILNAAAGAHLMATGLSVSQGHGNQPDPDVFDSLLSPAAQAQLHEGLGNLGIKEPITLTLADLKLSYHLNDQMNEIMAAFRQRRRVYEEWGLGRRIRRGRGIICLFDGDPGTGKTMGAEILAGALDLSLIRINTGQIIDKYIGETEKNLARLFGRAHPGLNLLLFDEADSLFGKRTKVERSNDRYANAAINALLQLVEGYEGIVVLTTNLKQGIDAAFERRFSYKLSFPMPEAEEREAIWRSFLEETTGLDEDVDYPYLAETFELSGGSIKNAVVRSANLALAAGTLINMEHIITACYRELASSGKLVRREW